MNRTEIIKNINAELRLFIDKIIFFNLAIHNNSYRAAISSLYYSSFYIARACILEKDVLVRKHKSLGGIIMANFVPTNELSYRA